MGPGGVLWWSAAAVLIFATPFTAYLMRADRLAERDLLVEGKVREIDLQSMAGSRYRPFDLATGLRSLYPLPYAGDRHGLGHPTHSPCRCLSLPHRMTGSSTPIRCVRGRDTTDALRCPQGLLAKEGIMAIWCVDSTKRVTPGRGGL